MSKGHTIPLLRLARLLLSRGLAAVTVITTPANRPFIAASLSDTAASILDIPFPENAPFIPAGVESTDHLPSVSLFFHLANATKLMRPHFDRTLLTLQPPVSFIISDGFLGWTLHSAKTLGVPRLVFYGMSNHAMTVSREVAVNDLASVPRSSDDEPFPIPSFPWVQLTRNDLDETFLTRRGPQYDFVVEQAIATDQSHGLLVNSFRELEPFFVDFWNDKCRPKAWCVGPFCLAQPNPATRNKNQLQQPKAAYYLGWLDRKLAEGKSVVYVAFGSQADISTEQIREIAVGLEESGANFLWVVRKNQGLGIGKEGEERVVKEGRGLIVREWVDQREVLGHRSVEGFVSHCGWNSVTESLCAGVAVAAWPMMAEQHLNARLVVDELRVGVRVETCDGSVRGFVRREGLRKTVKELMEGEKGREARKRAKEVAEAARKAVEEGGSSWRTLELLVQDACQKKT